ncbi:MAG: Uma2 family endonuclease, partial [Microcystis panniformis WG22]|nr:Uma2 family endonuclease [Microcystis panniformis WG22]
QFHKRGDHWAFRDYHDQEAILTLFSLDFQISLTDLYQRVDFTAIEVS